MSLDCLKNYRVNSCFECPWFDGDVSSVVVRFECSVDTNSMSGRFDLVNTPESFVSSLSLSTLVASKTPI